MADLYLMEDLKEAVSPSIASHLTEINLLETSQLGEEMFMKLLSVVDVSTGSFSDNEK